MGMWADFACCGYCGSYLNWYGRCPAQDCFVATVIRTIEENTNTPVAQSAEQLPLKQ